MNQQQQIKRILKEETQTPQILLRRLHFVDDEVEFRIKRIYTPNDICRFRSGEELLSVITDDSIEAMYYTYFSHSDDNSKEWGIMYRTMVEYINDKYGEKIKDYYEFWCPNKLWR